MGMGQMGSRIGQIDDPRNASAPMEAQSRRRRQAPPRNASAPIEAQIAEELGHFTAMTASVEHTHSVEDVTKMVEIAKNELKDHLSELPSDVHHPAMTKHLLAAYCESHGAVASFNSGSDPAASTDSIMRMMGNTEHAFTLVLDAPHQGHNDSIFSAGAEQKRFRDDCRTRIARAYNVEENRVVIGNVKRGSVRTEFLVLNLDPAQVGESLEKIRKEFNCKKVDVLTHPAAFVMGFDLTQVDLRGNKNFTKRDAPYFMVGPKDAKRKYVQPEGWHRVGVPVCRGLYDNDRWLHPFGIDDNWYRCFHGTGRHLTDKQGEYKEAVQDIAKNGLDLTKAKVSVFGKAGYVSDDSDYAELYSGKFQVKMADGKSVNYRTMFMFALRPGAQFQEKPQTLPFSPLRSGPGKGKTCGQHYGETVVEWVVEAPSTDNLRPYGLLFKED